MFADVMISNEAMGVVGLIVSGLVGAVVLNFRLLMKSHNRRLAEQRDCYEKRLADLTGRKQGGGEG